MEAGRKTLDIPFKGCRKGLIEIIDIENKVPLRSGKQAEIGEVAVAAGLDPDTGCRGVCKIHCHERGRSPVKCKDTLCHAAIANRDQVLEPAFA